MPVKWRGYQVFQFVNMERPKTVGIADVVNEQGSLGMADSFYLDAEVRGFGGLEVVFEFQVNAVRTKIKPQVIICPLWVVCAVERVFTCLVAPAV